MLLILSQKSMLAYSKQILIMWIVKTFYYVNCKNILKRCHRKVCQSIPNLIFRKEKEKNMLNNRCHKKVCQCALNAIILVINFVTEKYASPFHILIMWICKDICHKKVCHYALNTKIWVIDFVTEKYASISQISFFEKGENMLNKKYMSQKSMPGCS